MTMYSIVGEDGFIKFSQVKDMTFSNSANDRLLPDNPPAFDPTYQTCVRVEPVNEDAEEITYVVTYRPFSELKPMKIKMLNVLRDEKEASTFAFKGMNFDCDTRSVQRINTAVQAAQVALSAGQSFSLTWTSADNVEVALTAAEIIQMPAALAIHSNNVHQICKGLKTRVANALTPEAVIEVSWPEQ